MNDNSRTPVRYCVFCQKETVQYAVKPPKGLMEEYKGNQVMYGFNVHFMYRACRTCGGQHTVVEVSTYQLRLAHIKSKSDNDVSVRNRKAAESALEEVAFLKKRIEAAQIALNV